MSHHRHKLVGIPFSATLQLQLQLKLNLANRERRLDLDPWPRATAAAAAVADADADDEVAGMGERGLNIEAPPSFVSARNGLTLNWLTIALVARMSSRSSWSSQAL